MALRPRHKLAAELKKLRIRVAADPQPCQLSIQLIVSFV